MSEVVEVAAAARQLNAGASYGIWLLVLLAFVALVKAWPALRKLQIEADGALRNDLMRMVTERDARITQLELQMVDERRECLARLAELSAELEGLKRMIAQNSKSTAMMLTRPDDAAATKAATKERGE